MRFDDHTPFATTQSSRYRVAMEVWGLLVCILSLGIMDRGSPN